MDIAQLLLQPPNQGLENVDAARELQLRQAARSGGQEDQLKTVAKQFESIFVHQILKQMQETIEESSFDPEDSSNGQVHGLYCTFLADAVSEQGGLGFWEKIYEQMKQTHLTETDSPNVNARG